MYCTNCGNQLSNTNQKYCEFCGIELNNASERDKEEIKVEFNPNRSKRRCC